RRAWRRAAPVPGWSGAGAVEALGVASTGLRIGWRAGGRHRTRSDGDRALVRFLVAGGVRHRLRARDVVDGHRARVAWRTRRAVEPERTPRVRDPAFPGSRGDSVDRASYAAGPPQDRNA